LALVLLVQVTVSCSQTFSSLSYEFIHTVYCIEYQSKTSLQNVCTIAARLFGITSQKAVVFIVIIRRSSDNTSLCLSRMHSIAYFKHMELADRWSKVESYWSQNLSRFEFASIFFCHNQHYHCEIFTFAGRGKLYWKSVVSAFITCFG